MGSEQASSEASARFEQALRLFAELGLSAELSVNQLLRAGFDSALVRSRFPHLSAAAFKVPVEPRAARHPVLSSKARASANEKGGAPIAAQVLAQRALERTAAAIAAPALAINTAPARAISADLSEGISFQYVPLIQCSFPHTDPGAQSQFTRRNGWLELTLSTARPGTGLPYGVPARLLTIYCASEALRTRSPEIYLGASVQDFLRRLDVPITRGERGSLRVYANQLLRLIHCAVSIDENVRDTNGRTGLHIRQALFVEEARLWWDHEAGVGEGSSLVLSSVLFESMLERSAPLSTKAIRQLRKSPMDLDVYAWLAHRLFHLSKPSTVTWQQLSSQFGHSYSLLRKFRAFFAESVKRVLEVYPEAKVKLADVGVILFPSKPHVPRDAVVRSASISR